MSGARATAPQPDHQWLELEAVKALTRNDAMAAFECADRRCRISPPPLAYSHVLRGEALFRAGDRGGAVSAIRQALEIAPEDIAANRRMLSWVTGDARSEAASILLRVDRDIATLRRAIETLRAEGRRHFASCLVLHGVIEGWALYDGGGPAEMTIDDGSDSVTMALRGAPSADFPGMGAWIRFRTARPQSPRPQTVVIAVDGEVIHLQRTGAPSPAKALRSVRRGEVGQTVIVPIYGDVEATRACLASLCDELDASASMQAVLVNDASPDHGIVELLGAVSANPRIRVLTNERNLGFVGAVNRALEDVVDGDVVLLNADALPPPRFVSRLAAAARSASDIGIVMPLSNNADLASFPIPYAASPMGPRVRLEDLDRIASETNRGLVVDIPNGIGFCLYITRSCMEAVGGLCEDFQRGYLEDVDLSLRARAKGFRTVCAPSVYVGHAGSKSFGAEKRALVARNASVVHSRFPGYGLEFATFAAADPLREARQNIQRSMPLRLSRTRLIVTGAGAIAAVARARAGELSQEQSVLLLEARSRADGWRLMLSSLSDEDALAAEFDLSSPSQCEALVALLRRASIARIEILDPLQLPFRVVELLRELDAPYDIVIADAGLLGRERAANLFVAGTSFLRPSEGTRAAEQRCVHQWRAVVESADKVWAIDRRAHAFAANFLPQQEAPVALAATGKAARVRARRVNGDPSRLGLVPIRSCASEQRWMQEIARAFYAARPDLRLVVLGATLDDAALMRFPNVHVTGPIGDGELETVAASYALDRLIACVTQPLFGHPLLDAALEGSRPLAFVDWTGGAVPPRRHDLSLDPSLSLQSLMERLQEWIENRKIVARSVRH